MDQSPLYKKMCRHAREVQALWKPERGDVYIRAFEEEVSFWLEEDKRNFKKGFLIEDQGKIISMESRIWLPRQYQLMDMAQVKGVRFQDTSYRFYNFSKGYNKKKNPYLRELKSQEQLWLAFIMHDRFAKYWNKERWQLLLKPLN